MKTFILLLTIICLTQAQERRQLITVDEQYKELDELLKFTDVQKDTIKTLLVEFREKISIMRNEMNSSGGDRMAMMSMFREEIDKQNKKILAVLDADQRIKYNAYVEARMNRMRNQRN